MIGHIVHGEGPRKVIVLHGWFGDWSVFQPMLPALDLEQFSYAFMDYRGYGASMTQDGAFTIEEIAADALALADHLGWRRFHVLGHSMGGSAAQRVAVAAKDRVISCICVTPVPATGVPMPPEQWALFDGAAENDANRAGIIAYSTGNRLPNAWITAMVANSRRTTSKEAFAKYLHSWAKTDFSAEAKGLPTPVLAIIGEHDLALTADVMNATFPHLYPNFTMKVAPNAGHYPMIETPIWLAKLIEEFAAKHA